MVVMCKLKGLRWVHVLVLDVVQLHELIDVDVVSIIANKCEYSVVVVCLMVSKGLFQ